jgi:hypothetical protein
LTGPEVSFEREDLVKLKVKVYLFNNYLKKQKKKRKSLESSGRENHRTAAT